MAQRSEWIVEKTEASARDGMVAAMQPLAAEAGAEVLRAGGNAVDAAIATAYAVGVVEPFMSGVGGLAFMVYSDGQSGRASCLDGSTVLPRAIRAQLFELLPDGARSGMYGWRATTDDANNTGWLAPGVPGMPALTGEAHRRYGRLPWRELLQPAIQLAEDGFTVNPYVSLTIGEHLHRLARFPESRHTFLTPAGTPPPPGSRLRQPQLARSLRLIAEQGTRTLYEGELARLIAADMAANGGLIDAADLAAHATRVDEPAQTVDYRGYTIAGQRENGGFATVAQALQILGGYDIARMGYLSLDAFHLEIEALRRAFVDRLRYLGDAALGPVPYEAVLSPAYAAARRASLDPQRATPDEGPGDPWPFERGARPLRPTRSGNTGEGQTTHITVIDRERTMVSLTSTLGEAFGSAVVIKDTGITLNNATTWFDPEPGAVTSIGPGKRVMSAAAPVAVVREGRPVLALGAPGGRKVISAVYQCLVNALDFGLDMQAAISAPRMHCEGRRVALSARLPASLIEGLRERGHELEVLQEEPLVSHFARPNGIRVVGEELRGGVHQFTPATAIGVDTPR